MKTSRMLGCIVVLAIAVRLTAWGVAIHQVGEQGFMRGDAIGYSELAYNLAHGNGFSVLQNDGTYKADLFRTPGFPLLLAPFTLIPNGFMVYAFVMCMVAGILVPLLTYGIATRVTNDRAALAAVFLVALEPHAVFYSFLFQTEMAFMLFAFAGLYCALITFENRSVSFAALSGAFLAYAVYIRPGYIAIFLLLTLGTATLFFLKKDNRYTLVIVSCIVMLVLLAPWYVRNHEISGVYALSGAGWRNVYTDYLASVRSIHNDTRFDIEKRKLKDEALPRFGLTPKQIDDPANASILRDAALPELWASRLSVLKLETLLLVSFATNDGYYYDFRNLGYIHDNGVANISPSHELLSKGLTAIPNVVAQLARQFFIPLWGRLVTVMFLILSVAGFFIVQSRLRFLFADAIILTAVASTAIGFGVDARMRVPVEPLLFIFAGAALIWLYDGIRLRYAR